MNLLLDLDGTLVDSRPGIVSSIDLALRELGHAPDAGFDLGWTIGPPIAEVMQGVLRHYGDDRVTEAVAVYRRHYSAGGLFDATVYAGIPAALTALAGAGFTLFVATSKRRDFAERVLTHFGLADRFAAIHGADPAGGLDHKPELVAHILTRHALDPARTIMVGDRRHDIAGAHANGVRVIGVAWGYGAPGELAAADAMAGHPQELAGLARGLLDAATPPARS